MRAIAALLLVALVGCQAASDRPFTPGSATDTPWGCQAEKARAEAKGEKPTC